MKVYYILIIGNSVSYGRDVATVHRGTIPRVNPKYGKVLKVRRVL